jgi:hypothetical protein
LGLLLQAGPQGAFSQSGGSGAGDLLHRVEVHIQAGALVPEGAAGDDFAPTGGEVPDLLEQFGGKVASRHGVSCLVLAESVGDEVLRPLYDPPLSHAKLLMASSSGMGAARCDSGTSTRFCKPPRLAA